MSDAGGCLWAGLISGLLVTFAGVRATQGRQGDMWDSAVGPKLGLGPQVCGPAPGAIGVWGLLMEGLVWAVGA